MKLQTLVAWLLMIVVPAIIWSVYVYTSRLTRTFSTVTDYSALAVAVAVGTVGVLILFRSTRSRLLAALLYVAVAGSAMYLGMATSLCYLGDCP